MSAFQQGSTVVVRRYEVKMDTLEEMDAPDDEREASLDIIYRGE